MHDLLNLRYAALGAWTINGVNNLFYQPGTKIRAKRLILDYTTGNTTLGNVVTFKRRPLAGVAANEVTLFAGTTTITTVAGDIDYLDLGVPSPAGVAIAGSASGSPAGSSFVAGAENYPIIWPWQDIGFYSGGEGTAGVCNAWLEYEELPFVQLELEANNAAANAIRKIAVA